MENKNYRFNGSLFFNLEEVRLTDEERVYLLAASQGDAAIIRQSICGDEDEDDGGEQGTRIDNKHENEKNARNFRNRNLDVNCLDYMGRSALHLAVDADNAEIIDLLLDHINSELIEEALLHAVSKGLAKIVRQIIEHPSYESKHLSNPSCSMQNKTNEAFFRAEESCQFSPDVTPLILAAHHNDHEIIQLFLSRQQSIPKPHPISCQCGDCTAKQNFDSLKRSRSRLNAYKALASPAYMALSSQDPIMATFQLRQEMKKLAQVEKEFKNEYMGLVEQCMNFACELMDLCRGTQEVEAVLNEGCDDRNDPLIRLKMAVEYEEKKFVAHPNCQQHLTAIWYGTDMGFLQSMENWKKVLFFTMVVPVVPFVCLFYIISPTSRISRMLRCPATKFITHTLSHACFLMLLAVATFRLEEQNPYNMSNITCSKPHQWNDSYHVFTDLNFQNQSNLFYNSISKNNHTFDKMFHEQNSCTTKFPLLNNNYHKIPVDIFHIFNTSSKPSTSTLSSATKTTSTLSSSSSSSSSSSPSSSSSSLSKTEASLIITPLFSTMTKTSASTSSLFTYMSFPVETLSPSSSPSSSSSLSSSSLSTLSSSSSSSRTTTATTTPLILSLASSPQTDEQKNYFDNILKQSFRPANKLLTNVQICLMFWILGLLWIECKQLYHCGIRVYLLDYYNWMDFIILSLYLGSYVLRFAVDMWMKEADLYFNGTTRAREALYEHDCMKFDQIRGEIFGATVGGKKSPMSYFMKASRFQWKSDDPEIVSDVLFAVANVLSIARTTYLMPAFEVLGPLQISLGRMLGDISRFLVLFTLVLFAFMVGLHNLYWYYGFQTYISGEAGNKLVYSTEAFQGLPRTLHSLFWSMFGLVPVDSVEVKYPGKWESSEYHNNFPGGNHTTSVVEQVGMYLFALYHVTVIIVLTNMLIAMMSHSFEAIQGDCDVEWKFARTKLWMNYIDQGSTLPVPFNVVPTVKTIKYFASWAKEDLKSFVDCCLCRGSLVETDPYDDFFASEETHAIHLTNYSDILQRLVRRYLFKLERMKEENKDVSALTSDPMTQHVNEGCSGLHKETDKDGTSFGNRAVRLSSSTTSKTSDIATTGTSANFRKLSIKQTQLQTKQRQNKNRQSRFGRWRQPYSNVSSSFRSNQPTQLQIGFVQLVALPQLDLVQKILKNLDVRFQRLHETAKNEQRVRQDITHILTVILENQKALEAIIEVLPSLNEEITYLKAVQKQKNDNSFVIIANKKQTHMF